MTKEPITYQKSGVDPDRAAKILSGFAGYLKTRPRDPAILSGIGPFASCYSLKEALNGMEDPVLVTCCDGVGTKAKLASDWGNIDTLGEDLVAMNVNDLICVGARPTLFLDYYACGKLEESQLVPLLKSIQHGCELAGCSLVGGETAEMPGVYSEDDFDLAGFSVGLVDKKKILDASRVKVGDSLVAVASTGLHSNGYSLVRKLVDKEKLQPNDKTPFGGTWGEVLLAPTKIYVKAVAGITGRLHALAHITGGGLFENLPRVLPANTVASVRKSAWPFPPLFQWIMQSAGISEKQMLSTFNCGVGLIAAMPKADEAAVIEHLNAQNLKAWKIGEVSGGEGEAQVEWIV